MISPDLKELTVIAQEAAALIMTYWQKESGIQIKDDKSPVTLADQEADRLICARLAKVMPGVLVISEEGAQPDVSAAPRYFLVDPLDGTKSFIRHGKNFTVNIGLMENHVPVMGVIAVPAQGTLYAGEVGKGAVKMEGGKVSSIKVSANLEVGLKVLLSHTSASKDAEALLSKFKVASVSTASSALKFCKVAEGTADLYPRFGPTMEWDTAAGQAIVVAAGGRVETLDGEVFGYGKKGLLNGPFVAYGW